MYELRILFSFFILVVSFYSSYSYDANSLINWIENIAIDWMYVAKISYYMSRGMISINNNNQIDNIHRMSPVDVQINLPYLLLNDVEYIDIVSVKNSSIFSLNQYLSILRVFYADNVAEKNMMFSTQKGDIKSIQTTIFSIRNELLVWDLVKKRLIDLIQSLPPADSSSHDDEKRYLFKLLVIAQISLEILQDLNIRIKDDKDSILFDSFNNFISHYQNTVINQIYRVKLFNKLKYQISYQSIIYLFSIYYEESLFPFINQLLEEVELSSSVLISKATSYNKQEDDSQLFVINWSNSNNINNNTSRDILRIFFWYIY